MLKTLVLKEILNNLLNLRFALAYFLVTVLLVGSAAIMLSEYLTERDVYQVNKAAYDRRNDQQDGPYDYVFGNKFHMRPPSVTRVLALGEEKDADRKSLIACEFAPTFMGDFKRNPLANLFPTMDMLFVIGVVISLLIFALTYDSISGEREEGTLKVLLAGPVPRDLVLLAKYIGGLISLVAPLLTSWVVVLLLVLLTPGLGVTTNELTRLVLFFALSTLYIATIFAGSMAVSLVFRSSGAAILALLLVWVVLIVALPALGPSVGYLIVKPRSVQSVDIAAKRVGVLEWGAMNTKAAGEFKKRFGGRDFGQLSPEEQTLWNEWDRNNDFNHIEHITDSIVSILQRQHRQDERVESISRWVSRLSPFGCYQNAAVALSGTGMHRRAELQHALEAYAVSATEYAVDQVRNKKSRHEQFSEQGPQLRLPPVSLAASVQESMVDFGVLMTMAVLFFMGGYLVFARTEIL